MSFRRKRRNHPMTQLVLWLGLCLVAVLLALVHVVGKLPSSAQLESTHMEGMQVGYALCLGEGEQKQEQRIVKPVLIGGSL